MLAQRLGARPGEIDIVCGANGKPALSPRFDRGLRFNLSRSEELVVYAFSRQDVGVDVERVRPLTEADAIAAQLLSPQESETYRGLAPHERAKRFLDYWTRKEARAKALGTGISVPLRSLETSSAANFHPAPGFVAAACTC